MLGFVPRVLRVRSYLSVRKKFTSPSTDQSRQVSMYMMIVPDVVTVADLRDDDVTPWCQWFEFYYLVNFTKDGEFCPEVCQ